MNHLLIALLILPTIGLTQRITVRDVDKFTGQKRIETDYQGLKMGLVTFLQVKLRSVQDDAFMIFSGGGEGSGVIGDDDQLILLLENKDTVVLTSTGIQDYEINQSKSYKHQYRVSHQQLQKLASGKEMSMRKYLTDGYVDIDIPERNRNKIKNLCQILLTAMDSK
jgi:hypothetical protein